MKSILFSLFLIYSSVFAFSQESSEMADDHSIDIGCYQAYAKLFETRGANPIQDGSHDNIVLTVRKGTFSDCFTGKVMVKNGTIDPKSIEVQMVDKSYEPLNKTSKYDKRLSITNGISKTMITADDELINVLFIDQLKPKKKAFNRAPDPSLIE